MSSIRFFANSRSALGLALMLTAAIAVAGPPHHGGGSSGHRFDPGPRHGHGLPSGARELWLGSMLYFVAAGTYYLWSAERKAYVPVDPPPAAQPNTVSYEVIAYPAAGQSADQQGRDRYECHNWAVSQSGFDPATAQSAPSGQIANTYRRALGACLKGRGYSVN